MADFIELLKQYVGPKAFGLIAVAGCAVYIWYQHLRTKLLREQIEFEKRKRDDFLEEVVELKKSAPTRLPSEVTPQGEERVLVVDDEPWLRECLVLFLRHDNPSLKIETAADGKEAMERITNNIPSIMITDLMMPRVDGVTLLKLLHQKGELVPTLVISGYATPNTFHQMMLKAGVSESGSILFMPKPFTIEELRAALEKLKRESKKK